LHHLNNSVFQNQTNIILSVLSGSSEAYGFKGVLTDDNEPVSIKPAFFSVSKCSNTVSPEDGVAYTETCRELYET
jgi:hypothetical protein